MYFCLSQIGFPMMLLMNEKINGKKLVSDRGPFEFWLSKSGFFHDKSHLFKLSIKLKLQHEAPEHTSSMEVDSSKLQEWLNT